MKLLHTADLHLSCSLVGFSKEAAKNIRNDCMATFMETCGYARKNGINHILIAGDLFDTLLPSFDVRKSVVSVFRDYGEITFYLISGNHDKGFSKEFLLSLPANVKLFGQGFSSYEIEDDVVITSTEDTFFDVNGLNLDENKVNIVMFHGEPSMASGDYAVKMQLLEDIPCDYLALGHYHSYGSGSQGRGSWVMCGSPHARGFDETGEKGFVEIEINGREVAHRLVKREGRRFFRLYLDINGGDWYDFSPIEELLRENGVTENDFVKINVTGQTSSSHTDVSFIENTVLSKGLASFVRVVDKTQAYTGESSSVSLYGEFKRLVEADESIPDEDKAEILRYGYLALQGEEVDRL